MKLIKPKFLLLISLVALLLGCSLNTKKIETFYVDEGMVQYFVRPTNLHGDNGDISMDFTIRTKDSLPDKTICNFTIESDVKYINNLSEASFIIDGDKTINLQDPKVIYKILSEKKARYTSQINKSDFNDFINSKTFKLIIKTNDITSEYKPTKDFKKKLDMIRINFL